MSQTSIADSYAKRYSEFYSIGVGYEGPFECSMGQAFTFHFTDEDFLARDNSLPLPIVVISPSGTVSEIPFSSADWLKVAGEISNEDEE